MANKYISLAGSVSATDSMMRTLMGSAEVDTNRAIAGAAVQDEKEQVTPPSPGLNQQKFMQEMMALLGAARAKKGAEDLAAIEEQKEGVTAATVDLVDMNAQLASLGVKGATDFFRNHMLTSVRPQTAAKQTPDSG